MSTVTAVIVTALAVTAMTVAAPAAPAMAHTVLSRTAPAAKSTVTRPVTSVTLTFTGLIKKPGTAVAVTGPDRASYSDGDPQVLDRTVTQKVRPLPVGAITVAWRTVAGDGHPLQGSFAFTNRAAPPAASPPAATAPTATAPTATPPAASPPAVTAPAVAPAGQSAEPAARAGGDGSTSALVWAGIAVAGLVLALLGGLLWWRRRPPTGT
jgi:methionine-rich copper-binding protein CopC